MSKMKVSDKISDVLSLIKEANGSGSCLVIDKRGEYWSVNYTDTDGREYLSSVHRDENLLTALSSLEEDLTDEVEPKYGITLSNDGVTISSNVDESTISDLALTTAQFKSLVQVLKDMEEDELGALAGGV